MEAIRIWLNGRRDYKTGVRLYSLFGKDMLLKRSFLEAETPYKRNRLIEELQKLVAVCKPVMRVTANQLQEMAVKAPVAPAAPKVPENIYEYRWSPNPDQVERSIYLRWKQKYVELMDLVSRVGDVARAGEKDHSQKEEAGRMALRILNLDDEVEEIYAERNYYLDKGKQKATYPYGEPCQDPLLIPTKLQNAMRYVRQYKTALAKDPADTAAANNLEKHQWFVSYYKKMLKQPHE